MKLDFLVPIEPNDSGHVASVTDREWSRANWRSLNPCPVTIGGTTFAPGTLQVWTDTSITPGCVYVLVEKKIDTDKRWVLPEMATMSVLVEECCG